MRNVKSICMDTVELHDTEFLSGYLVGTHYAYPTQQQGRCRIAAVTDSRCLGGNHVRLRDGTDKVAMPPLALMTA